MLSYVLNNLVRIVESDCTRKKKQSCKFLGMVGYNYVTQYCYNLTLKVASHFGKKSTISSLRNGELKILLFEHDFSFLNIQSYWS